MGRGPFGGCATGGAGGAFGTAGAGSPADTTGKSDSSSEPSAGGKSDGMDARCAGAGGAGGAGGFGAAAGIFCVGAAAGIFCVGAAGGAMPTMVRCLATPGGGGGGLPGAPGDEGAGGRTGGGAGGAAAAGAAAPGAFGFITRNECPHFGHRIFKPAGGTRRSSSWYGALHDSHSTLSIDVAIVSRAQVQTRFLPPRLARYIAWSAAWNSASASLASPGMDATPQLRPGCTRTPSFS